MIAIYQGEGTSWKGPLPDRFISAQEIIDGGLKGISLFIMPGGRDRPYHAALKGAGNAQIRAFVERGGTYLGICAGAYYGCKTIEFEKGLPSEICEERELSFFSGTAVGPIFPDIRLAKVGSSLSIYYHDGCCFRGDFSSVKILARYLELPSEPPAIIECSIGKGKAILSGVHFELGHLTQDISPDQVEMQMKDRLACIGAVIR